MNKTGTFRKLVITLFCVAGVLPASNEAFSAENALLPHQEMAREILRELIGINTTHSSGDNTAAAQAMADRLLAAGFPEEDIHVIVPAARKGNLVARYRGRNLGLQPLLLLAHIDVVEANPADWTLDPFTLTEQDGFFYGRGVIDDKDEAAIYVANLIRLKQEGFVPDRDIIIALTADEEGGTHNGVQFLLENHRELIEAEFALNEGGGGYLQGEQQVLNRVQASEKVYQSYRLTVLNPGGHSSVPRRDNAIYQLVDALSAVRDFQFPVKLNEVTRMYFERSAEMQESEIANAMASIAQDPTDSEAAETLSQFSGHNALLRTTCVATMLNAGHAENALPQRAQATVNCRVLPDEPITEVQRMLEEAIDDERVYITPVATATQSPSSPLTPPILSTIEEITQSMWPGVPVIPSMSTGATDSLYLRNAGIPVYGVSGIFDDGTSGMHGRNERLRVRSFYEGQEFLFRLTKELSRVGDGA